MIVVSLAFLLPKKIIDVATSVEESYNSLDSQMSYLIDLSNLILKFIPNNIVTFIIGWLMIAVLLLSVILKLFYKKDELYILKISTLKASSSKIYITTDIKKKIRVKNLDLLRDTEPIKIAKSDFAVKALEIIKTIDKNVVKVRRAVNKNDFSIIGIFHTPFALRAGYLIGDAKEALLLHKNRNDDYYSILNNSATFPQLLSRKNLVDNSRELIVAISTSFSISDESLTQFNINYNNYIKFETEILGFDVINSSQQCIEYRRKILNEVRKIVNEKSITRIHLVMASSVCFTLFLGQGLNKQYDPPIVCCS